MNDKVTALADQVRAALAQAPTTAQQVAAKYNVDFVNVADYKPGAALPGIGVNQDLDSTISGLQKGQVSPVAPVSPSKLAVAVVTNVTPAHVQPLSAVEAQVRDRVIDQKAIQVAGEKAKAAAATLKSNGGDLQAIAKNFGLQVKSSDLFTRNGAVQGLGAGAQFQAAFTEPVGSIIGPYATAGGTVVAKVVQKVEPDMTQLAAQKSALAQDIKERRADQMLQLFRDSVLSHLIKDGKVKIHRDAINNLLTRYRS